MAAITFGNFPVDMRDATFLDALVGHNFDQLDHVVPSAAEFDEFFTSGARIVLHGNFTLGPNSTITGIDMFNPGDVLLASVVGIVGVTAAGIASATPLQVSDMVFGQVTEVTTQGFDDFIVGDNTNEIAHTGAGHDVIQGNGGDDILDGQAGADDMFGGTGNDTYFVDNGGDTVNELPGQGSDTVHSVINFVLPADVEK